jgi:hypothetical protein
MLAEKIAEKIAQEFRCFGGNQGRTDNPVAHALDKGPLVFAGGVNVLDVVRFVIREIDSNGGG